MGVGAVLDGAARPRAEADQRPGGVGGFKFGEHLHEKRCLIPADGFYEWRRDGQRKRARHFTLATGRPFAFAGLWDVWRGDKKLLTCCLITTPRTSWCGRSTTGCRSSCRPTRYAEWLDPETPEARL